VELDRLNQALGAIYSGRPWIMVAEASAATTRLVAQLREWGVDDVLVISAAPGTGDQPDATQVHLTGSSGTTIMEGVRAFAASLDREDVAAAVEVFDPQRKAFVLAPPFGLDRDLAGRRLYGGRRPEWRALEDKTVIDGLWDRAGVRRAPSVVVPVAQASEAHTAMASEMGSVWVADNSTGWHGGGEFARWVPSSSACEGTRTWFESRAHQVRVMPFLDGIPCSIHGFVSPTGIASFRPVEMLIARTEPAGFFYMGFATTWDPPASVREEMRTAARAVARVLSNEVAYRGSFSIDGVATVEGFRPTELNPRLSPGLGIQTATVEGLPFGLATRAMIEGDLSLDTEWLEDLVVGSADERRVAASNVIAPESTVPDRLDVIVRGSGILDAGDEHPDGELATGPAAAGSYTRLTLESDAVARGASMAPYAVSAAALAARTWDLTVPDLRPAPDVLG
jgi:hypothetical protein